MLEGCTAHTQRLPYGSVGKELYKTLDEAFNKSTTTPSHAIPFLRGRAGAELHARARRSALKASGTFPGTAEYAKQIDPRAKDTKVAITVKGEKDSLAHFDVGQAFAWEFLRRKQVVTKADIELALKIQKEEEDRIAGDMRTRQRELAEIARRDAAIAAAWMAEEEKIRRQTREELQRDEELAKELARGDADRIESAERQRREMLEKDEAMARALSENLEEASGARALTAERDSVLKRSDAEIALKLVEQGNQQAAELFYASAVHAATYEPDYLDGIRPHKFEFSRNYRCVEPVGKQHTLLRTVNSIILPPEELGVLADAMGGKPLAFKVTNLLERTQSSDRFILMGVAEFNAEPYTCILPNWVMAQLFAEPGDAVNVELVELEDATELVLAYARSGAADTSLSIADIRKSLQQYSCLSVGSPVKVKRDWAEWDMCVKECSPSPNVSVSSPETVRIVVEDPPDTKLEESEDLKEACSPVVSMQSGADHLELAVGQLRVGNYHVKPLYDTVALGTYKYYCFHANGSLKEANIIVEVEALMGDPDLYISQKEAHPTVTEYTWCAATTAGDEVRIPTADANRDNSKIFYVGVHAFRTDTTFKLAVFGETLKDAQSSTDVYLHTTLGFGPVEALPNHSQCYYCRRFIPDSQVERHEAFCYRSTFKCSECGALMRREMSQYHIHCKTCGQAINESEEHVHCKRCGMGTSPGAELEKHMQWAHVPIECSCGTVRLELHSLLLHKQYECPLRSNVFEGKVEAGEPHAYATGVEEEDIFVARLRQEAAERLRKMQVGAAGPLKAATERSQCCHDTELAELKQKRKQAELEALKLAEDIKKAKEEARLVQEAELRRLAEERLALFQRMQEETEKKRTEEEKQLQQLAAQRLALLQQIEEEKKKQQEEELNKRRKEGRKKAEERRRRALDEEKRKREEEEKRRKEEEKQRIVEENRLAVERRYLKDREAQKRIQKERQRAEEEAQRLAQQLKHEQEELAREKESIRRERERLEQMKASLAEGTAKASRGVLPASLACPLCGKLCGNYETLLAHISNTCSARKTTKGAAASKLGKEPPAAERNFFTPFVEVPSGQLSQAEPVMASEIPMEATLDCHPPYHSFYAHNVIAKGTGENIASTPLLVRGSSGYLRTFRRKKLVRPPAPSSPAPEPPIFMEKSELHALARTLEALPTTTKPPPPDYPAPVPPDE